MYNSSQITISKKLKSELERRKIILSRRVGKKVSFDFVIRQGMGV